MQTLMYSFKKNLSKDKIDSLTKELKEAVNHIAIYSNTGCDEYLKLAERIKQIQMELYDFNETPTTEELIEQFIVNQLGINLCSVKGILIERQDDNQIKQIIIDFKPDNSGK